MKAGRTPPPLHLSIPPLVRLLADLASRLSAAGRDEASLKAETLVAHVAGVRRLDLYARRGLGLTPEQAALLDALAARVAAGEPIQYALGSAPFLGREFKVDRRALIPRPETEELVEAVLAHEVLWRGATPALADVGTGTGCIALTLAAERPCARVIAIDVSEDALALARENAVRLGLAERVEWRRGDLLAGVAPASLDAVVSNPPYVATGDLAGLAQEIRAHEPRGALDGGPGGLEIIGRLIDEAFVALRPGGTLFLETGESQGAEVRRRMAARGFANVETRRDLAGHERLTMGAHPGC